MTRDYRHLIGHDVVVQNPRVPSAQWSGRAIAYTLEPSIEIEQENGERISLPLDWATQALSG